MAAESDNESSHTTSSLLGDSGYDVLQCPTAEYCASVSGDESLGVSDGRLSRSSSWLSDLQSPAHAYTEKKHLASDSSPAQVHDIEHDEQSSIVDSISMNFAIDKNLTTLAFEEDDHQDHDIDSSTSVRLEIGTLYCGQQATPCSSQETYKVFLQQGLERKPWCPGGQVLDVVFLASPPNKSAILEKLGSALLAGNLNRVRESDCTKTDERYCVVSIPDLRAEAYQDETVLIEAGGPELSVRECETIDKIRGSGNDGTLRVTFDNESAMSSIWQGNGYELFCHSIPDLVVSYVKSRETELEQENRRNMQKILRRHSIPNLIIAENLLLTDTARNWDLDSNLPHFCLEPSKTTVQDSKRPKIVPVDLENFLKIESDQLARSLACTIDHAATLAAVMQQQTQVTEKIDDGEENIEKIEHGLLVSSLYRSWLGSLAGLLVLILLLLSAAVGIKSLWQDMSPGVGMTALVTREATVSVSLSESKHVLPTASASAISLDFDIVKMPTASSLTYAIATRYAPSAPAKREPTLQDAQEREHTRRFFQAKRVGTDHVIISPPNWYDISTNSPAIRIKVQSGKRAVAFEKIHLWEEVFALKILDEVQEAAKIDIVIDKGYRFSQTIRLGTGLSADNQTNRGFNTESKTPHQNSPAQVFARLRAPIGWWKDKAIAIQRQQKKFTIQQWQKILQQTPSMETILAPYDQATRFLDRHSDNAARMANIFWNNISANVRHAHHFAGACRFRSFRDFRFPGLSSGRGDLERMVLEMSDHRRRLTRSYQKQLLKTWWQLRGYAAAPAQYSFS